MRFFPWAAIARLGVAMSRLAVLWAVQGGTGSFGQAGAATGAFAVADAAVGPQVGRLVDRWGQRRVVSATVVLFIAAAIGLAIGSARGWPTWALIGLAGVAGATAPPVGALSAARWRKVVGSSDRLRSALSLEGSLNDVTFLVGPVLVTTLSATVVSWCGLIAAVGLVAVGMAGLLTARWSEPVPAGSSAGLLVDRRLMSSRFGALFVANLAMGLFFGGVPVTVTAFALAHGAGALAGPIAAGSSVISLTAGLVYGGTQRGKPLTVMTTVSVIITIGAAMLALVPNVPVMFIGYGLVGGCVALILIPAAVLLQQATASEVYTQAMTWINSASAIGIAIAAPLVGYLVQSHGWAVGFLATAALTAILPLTLLLTRPVLIVLQHDAVSTDAGS
ncbi:MFS transporter [Microlunatus soli]|uniref:MFS transporter n=1 Tax=Microlunatus soli TaxID=630515 RepID=UPI000B88FB8D|nr:MFS transporter [Microlunatus soli]